MNNDERVSLQYSIKLQDLPNEIARLIDKASSIQTDQLGKRFKKLKLAESYELLTPDALSDIQQLRFTLSDVDATLGDIENIVTGFISMQEEGKSPPAQDDELPPTEFEISDELSEASELVDKLRLFREKGKLRNAEEPSGDTPEQPV
jgi:hypothetical protein